MTEEATILSRQYADLLRAGGCSERTIDNYLYALKGFTHFLGERSLREASADDIIGYQVDVAARGLSDSAVRVATYALRGFFHKVLERNDWNFARLPRPRRPKRLPDVLSLEEVEAILDAAPSRKYRAAFMLAYGSGLRTDEVVHLGHCRELLHAEEPASKPTPAYESRGDAVLRPFGHDLRACPKCRDGRLIMRVEWCATRLPLNLVIADIDARAP